MGNTVIQTKLVTLGAGSGLVDDVDGYIEIFRTLITTYVPGLPAFYKGLRPLESEDVNVPCTMIQPLALNSDMTTTAKTHTFWLFDFWYVVGDNTIDATTVKMTNVGMIFRKLFSNNALNDRGTAGATNNFKTYGTNWVDSKMSKIDFGAAIKYGRPDTFTYVAVGNFQLRLETQKLI
jgi:hypothetical protein